MARESEPVMSITARDSSATILHEIDQSIDLLTDEDAPYVADNLLCLDADETYRLLISLQEVFKQGTNQ
jgi:hypothetical protein